MHYFHYVSASKIDMLFPQVPESFLTGLKVELGFDFGFLKGKLAGERHDPTTRIAQVLALERFFEKEGLLRTCLEEGTWMRGHLYGRAGCLPSYEGLVLFGSTLDKTTVLLAGSESNLISGSANPGKDKGWSFMPRTLHSMKKYLEQDMDLLDLETDRTTYPGAVAESYMFHAEDGFNGALWRAFHSMPEDALPEPNFKMSFLARIFLVRENQSGEILAIGSPLYIRDDA